MGIGALSITESDIVAGQKVFASTETARNAQIEAWANDQVVAKAMNLDTNQTVTGVKDFSGNDRCLVKTQAVDNDSTKAASTAFVLAQIASTVAGRNVQVVNSQDGEVNTTTTRMNDDDTIPQITEGKEFLSLAITPTNASNKLKIEVILNVASSGNDNLIAGLFQDSTADALAAAMIRAASTNQPYQIIFTHYMTAGTTSETTFTVRAGRDDAGTLTFNGSSSLRKLGGVMASSITITEIKV